MIKVKICGITNLEDARAALEEGADALGFVFYPKSPRYIDYQKAADIVQTLPPFVITVGVFVNESKETILKGVKAASLSLVQLHGNESPEFCNSLGLRIIKAIRISVSGDLDQIKNYSVQGILLDSFHEDLYGGTGRPFKWDILKGLAFKNPIILSGGLDPENVRDAVDRLSPYAVDVSSGVETSPGIKNREKMKRFIQNAKGIR